MTKFTSTHKTHDGKYVGWLDDDTCITVDPNAAGIYGCLEHGDCEASYQTYWTVDDAEGCWERYPAGVNELLDAALHDLQGMIKEYADNPGFWITGDPLTEDVKAIVLAAQ